MKITGEKLLAAVILLLYIEWWIGTITYIANKNNVMGLAWLALAGMLVMGGLAAGLKKVNCIAVILIEIFSVIIWDCLLYGCGYVALFYFALTALVIAVILTFLYIGVFSREADIRDFFNRKLYFASGVDELDRELENNCFDLVLSARESKKFSVPQICDLLTAIKDKQQADAPADLRYYLWYDALANALRFGFINAAHDKLPFGCKLQIVDSEAEIVQNFLASSAGTPLDLANFTDDIKDDEEREFVLKVYQEIIHKD